MMFDNLRSLDGRGPGLEGQVVMLSVTAPGSRPVWDPETGEVVCDGLEWDEAHCADRGPHKHDGRAGCQVLPWQAFRWNASADKRWSRLHRVAATAVRRRFGPDSLVLLVRALELQHRGVKHFHPVLLAGTPRRRAAVEAYRARLETLAPLYGFGFVSRKVKPQSGRAAAAYLSAYFITGSKRKATLQESVQHPAMAHSRLLWMNPRLTTKTGVTMRELRFRRFVWVRYQRLGERLPGWAPLARTLTELERDRGRPLTGDEVVAIIGNDWVLRIVIEIGAFSDCAADSADERA